MSATTGLRRHALLTVGGRSELVFHPLHGEPLYAHALRALAEAVGHVMVGVEGADPRRVATDVERWGLPASVVVGGEWWDIVREAPEAGLLVHDPRCPLIPADFLTSMGRRADERPQASFVAVRPVTDTLKAVVDGRIVGTIDRDGLVSVTSPVVVSPEVLVGAAGAEAPPVHDLASMVGWLRRRGEVELVRAPYLGRRVEHERAVHLLECVDEVARRVRTEAGHPASAAEDRP